jgi:glycyl-tRNA synthetase beta chain
MFLPKELFYALEHNDSHMKSMRLRSIEELVEELKAKGVDARVPLSWYFSPNDESMEGHIVRCKEVFDFVLERLRAYYADQGVSPQYFESVYVHRPGSLFDFDRRLKAIGEFAKLPDAEALAAANKRIRNILKKADIAIPDAVDASKFQDDAERALHAVVEQAIADTDPLLANRDYVAVLARLARLRPEVDTFFDKVMVNADDQAVRANRLALLQRLADRLGSVAAIEHLSV